MKLSLLLIRLIGYMSISGWKGIGFIDLNPLNPGDSALFLFVNAYPKITVSGILIAGGIIAVISFIIFVTRKTLRDELKQLSELDSES